MNRPVRSSAHPARRRYRTLLGMGWYDMTIAGLILVICVGALVRLAASTPQVEVAYAYTTGVAHRIFHRRHVPPAPTAPSASSAAATPIPSPRQ